MDSSLKQRLVGATVLVALAVIFLPMLVKGPAPDSGVSDVSMAIPAEAREDGNGSDQARTVDLPLSMPGAAPQGGAVGMPADAQEDEGAALASGRQPAAIAAGDYAVSFGSYANAVDADRVITALGKARLPAYREATKVNGREAQRVRIGPFADRATAESARLGAGLVNDKVDAKVVVLDANAAAPATVAAVPALAPVKPESLPPAAKPVPAPAPLPVTSAAKPVAAVPPASATPAPPAPTAKPPVDTSGTGFAVQVGAFAGAADAAALRDKLRAAGFNPSTDPVPTDRGVRTRVRSGPAMTRAEADALNASVKAKMGLSGMVRPHP